MSKYTILINWTEHGVRNVKDTIKRAKSFESAVEKQVVNLLVFIIQSEDMTW